MLCWIVDYKQIWKIRKIEVPVSHSTVISPLRVSLKKAQLSGTPAVHIGLRYLGSLERPGCVATNPLLSSVSQAKQCQKLKIPCSSENVMQSYMHAKQLTYSHEIGAPHPITCRLFTALCIFQRRKKTRESRASSFALASSSLAALSPAFNDQRETRKKKRERTVNSLHPMTKAYYKSLY